ncbi:hypothetical protein LTR84_003700 [Exophiala bonariae]|uniref:Flavin reductase like domain-containing protein n=1 Tax=Exophiala bonariae TaxID=1690606 RepID=A0AAV9N5V3_9EURO|nr:hypothetical protein LTR84_003700 [Exophiala bonariae]
MATTVVSAKLARASRVNSSRLRPHSLLGVLRGCECDFNGAPGARTFQILCRLNSGLSRPTPSRNNGSRNHQHHGALVQTNTILSGAPKYSRSQHTAPATSLEKEHNTKTSEDLSNSVKRLMRHVPHPVAVITATDVSVNPEGGSEGWRGATVSSFNTVTLSPKPVVSFNIRKISSTFDAMRSSGLFNVHLLSEAIEATDIASKFASGNASSPFHDEEGEIESFAHLTDPARTAPSSKLPPILQSRDENGHLMVPFRLHCRYMPGKVVEVGDHVVLFGEVLQIFHDDNAFHGQGSSAPKPCLVYVNGRYVRVESHSSGIPFVQRRKFATAPN